MKKILVLVLALILSCGMLTSCDNAEKLIEKADAALQEEPYKVTMKMAFECDNKEINDLFANMNMEIPVVVDGKNLAMDMSMDMMGYSADIKMTVVDMVMYYDMNMMGQSAKMKTTMSEEQYKEFMEDSNTEMIVKPEDFAEMTVEKKDGKKYITCGEIKQEGLDELNEMIEDTLEAMGSKATIGDISFRMILDDGKYDSMELSCVYSMTVAGETYNVTLKMTADYSYDNVAAVTAPADAAQYQETNFSELFGD